MTEYTCLNSTYGYPVYTNFVFQNHSIFYLNLTKSSTTINSPPPVSNGWFIDNGGLPLECGKNEMNFRIFSLENTTNNTIKVTAYQVNEVNSSENNIQSNNFNVSNTPTDTSYGTVNSSSIIFGNPYEVSVQFNNPLNITASQSNNPLAAFAPRYELNVCLNQSCTGYDCSIG